MFGLKTSNVKPAEEPATLKQGEHLEDILTSMIRYGKPRVSYQGDGWYCCIEMNTNSDGVAFDVKSEFHQPDPITAATMCRTRMLKAISVYKE